MEGMGNIGGIKEPAASNWAMGRESAMGVRVKCIVVHYIKMRT